MSHRGCRVHPGTLGSPRRSLGVVGLIRGRRCVLWDTPWDRVVHPGSLGSLKCALAVVGFIQCWWFHWGAPWGSLRSSGDAGFTGESPGGRRAHPRSLHSLAYTVGSCGSSGFTGFTEVCSGGRRFHPMLVDSLGFAMRVVGYIWRR